MPSSTRSIEAHATYPHLTFEGAVEHSPAVASWFESQPGEMEAIARHWFSYFRACGLDVKELLHDGCPVACVQNAPFGYVNAFRTHVNVGFFHGASLPDPARLLEGTGKYMRHVKLRPHQPYSAPAIEALIADAYTDIRARLKAGR